MKILLIIIKKINSSIYSCSNFVSGIGAWFVRGSEAKYKQNDVFAFQYLDGNLYSSAAFRSSIS